MHSNTLNIAREVAVLERMTAKQHRDKFAEVFGETTNANNRTWLLKRIVWRLQAQAEGDHSERVQARAAELARDADLRVILPSREASGLPVAAMRVIPTSATTDKRLPPAGSIITRKYKGLMVQVRILTDRFEYAGEVYRTLSAVAKVITGSHCNGFTFFRLTGKERAA